MLKPFHGLFTAIKQSGNVPLKNKLEQNYFSKKNCLLSRKNYYFMRYVVPYTDDFVQ